MKKFLIIVSIISLLSLQLGVVSVYANRTVRPKADYSNKLLRDINKTEEEKVPDKKLEEVIEKVEEIEEVEEEIKVRPKADYSNKLLKDTNKTEEEKAPDEKLEEVIEEIEEVEEEIEEAQEEEIEEIHENINEKNIREVRAAWISYIEYAENRPGYSIMIRGQKEEVAKANIVETFRDLKSIGINTIVAQVRPFCDAIYPSELSPTSLHISPTPSGGKQGDEITWDILQYMIDVAHENDMEIHAWFNPYRVASNNNLDLLADNNQAKIWKLMTGNEANDFTQEFRQSNGSLGLSLNPARDEVIDYIVEVVKEVVENYDVDGIHFDDYFYPTLDESFDGQAYAEYIADGGYLDRNNWRLANVSKLIKKTYDVVHSETAKNKNLVFGISPQGNVSQNYNSQMADVRRWTSEPGFIDYITPQIYYGFKNSGAPFTETVDEWAQMIALDNVSLYVGLPAYKIGTTDSWAGAVGSEGYNEFITNSQILQRMILKIRSEQRINGYTLFDYRSLFKPVDSIKSKILKEREELKSLNMDFPNVNFSLETYALNNSNFTMEWALLDDWQYFQCTDNMDLTLHTEKILMSKGLKVRFIAEPFKEILFVIEDGEIKVSIPEVIKELE